MYRALWSVLPGPRWAKTLQSVILGIAVVALLFFVVFPFVADTFLVEESTVG
ncbi:hypothetical protein C3B54_11190 [Pontimonas salivibrio]|jgi:hypothetical protein|uniref:ABC transporter permease n=1 Tax=Pontimonas salivibrio TaxID=1159327 RepID=A0A2L2BNF8_9MICO|nr:hypothetical protein [Pontimonas salivibrio]AVG23194.1 hypothetical protein C3B54_11190 [Pontimonas salivibrio]